MLSFTSLPCISDRKKFRPVWKETVGTVGLTLTFDAYGGNGRYGGFDAYV